MVRRDLVTATVVGAMVFAYRKRSVNTAFRRHPNSVILEAALRGARDDASRNEHGDIDR